MEKATPSWNACLCECAGLYGRGKANLVEWFLGRLMLNYEITSNSLRLGAGNAVSRIYGALYPTIIVRHLQNFLKLSTSLDHMD